MHAPKTVTSIGLITFFIISVLFAPSGQSKSLYVNVIDPGTVNAYKIVGDHIQYQTAAQNLVYYGSSPVGLTIDPDSGIAFITYEGKNVIELLNAKTMVSLQKITTVSDATNLAGIAFDKKKQKIYVVDRGTNHLFAYFWNARTKTLDLEGGTYKILSNLGGYLAHGVALDSLNAELYVTNAQNVVHRYDVVTWKHKGSIPIVVDSTPREAVGIDIDSNRRYMYTGSFTGTSGSHTYLVRTDINDPNNPSFSEKNIWAYVIGLAIDEETGYLYVTAENNTLHVYNTLTWPSDPCYVESSGIIDPAGMCLGGDVEYKPLHFLLTKDDDIPDVNCVLPDVYITYTITYDANGHSDSNVFIVDHLPQEVDYNSSLPLGNYNEVERTVSWNLLTVLPDDNNTFTLTVKVNELAEPLGTIINLCEIEGDSTYNVVEINTPVCAWNPVVIYVDANATGSNTGMSWDNAYRDLQDALERARAGCGSEIWVAGGTYRPSERTDPNNPSSSTFKLVDGVGIYGGFAGWETCNNQSNPTANPTILTGDLNNDGYGDYGDAMFVVTASNDVVQATIIDGFTITKGYEIGIYCNGGSPTIAHNIIKENIYDGIYCDGASPSITQNTIQQNNWQAGVFCKNNSSPDIKDCLIQDNVTQDYATVGIGCDNSNPNITDCLITRNGNESGNGGGIYNYSSSPTVTNCVFRENHARYGGGIYNQDSSLPTVINCIFSENDAQTGGGMVNFSYSSSTVINCTFRGNTADDYGGGMHNEDNSSPVVTNCIFWDNYAGTSGHQIYNNDSSSTPAVSYCDIQDGWQQGEGNIDRDPCFYDEDDPNSYHLAQNSPCIDKGTNTPPNVTLPETDIDGEDRVKDGDANDTWIVDMGADEYYLSPADFNDDLIVNFIDYTLFANVWQSSNPEFSLDDDNDVDYSDLARFCEDWLWQAGWTKNFTCGAGQDMSQTMAAGFALTETSSQSIFAEQQIEKAEPLKIEELIDWLEKLWIDEESQNLIDEDVLLKFIESLKEDYKIH